MEKSSRKWISKTIMKKALISDDNGKEELGVINN